MPTRASCAVAGRRDEQGGERGDGPIVRERLMAASVEMLATDPAGKSLVDRGEARARLK